MEHVEWIKDAAGHYWAKDGDWRIDYDIGGNTWEMRVRGLHVGNAHTLSAGKAKIGKYDVRPGPERVAVPDADRDGMAMLATVEQTYLAPEDIQSGRAYFVTTGSKLTDGIRQAVAHAMDEIGTAPTCTVTWVESIRAWHVTIEPGASWPVSALAELLYMRHVVVHKVAIPGIDTANDAPHTGTVSAPPSTMEGTSVTQTRTRKHDNQSAVTSTNGHANGDDEDHVTSITLAPSDLDDQTPGDKPDAPADEWAELKPPIAHNPQQDTRDYRFDAIKSTPEPIRKLAEASLAINAKRVAAKENSTAERPRVNYHWDIQPVKDRDQGERFVKAIEKYGKYRPANVTIPHRAEGTPDGQITVRCGDPILWVEVDGQYRQHTATDTDPGFWGVRYSARPFEQRGSIRRLPGSAT